MIRVTDQISIAPWELSESFGRAYGPGGQNVNMVEAAAAAGDEEHTAGEVGIAFATRDTQTVALL